MTRTSHIALLRAGGLWPYNLSAALQDALSNTERELGSARAALATLRLDLQAGQSEAQSAKEGMARAQARAKANDQAEHERARLEQTVHSLGHSLRDTEQHVLRLQVITPARHL